MLNLALLCGGMYISLLMLSTSIPDQTMIPEAEKVNEDKDSELEEDQPISVLRPLLSTHAKKKEKRLA